MKRFSQRSFRGFTLIELMVAVAIIGILSAIVIPNYTTAQAKARDSKRVSDIAQLQLALERYLDRCGVYPTSLGITIHNNCPTNIDLGSFISKIPTPPQGTNQASYLYAANDDTTYYHLGTALELSNRALSEDIDFDSSISDPITNNDNSWVNGFNGADSPNKIYDVVPD